MNRHGADSKEQNRSFGKNRFCVVIPVYNHGAAVEKVITGALELKLPVFVVNDGSTDDTSERIRKFSGIRILDHTRNLGKGAALLTGFYAAAESADWAVTMDADGQHNPADARALIRAARENPEAIIVGHRTGMDAPGVHWTSRFGRQFSNFWVRVCGGPKISDSQSGFRIYPLPGAASWGVRARRFEFEVEILVRAHWKGVPVIEVPVRVSYLPAGQRISHFRPYRDFFRNAKTFSRLMVRRWLIRPGKTASGSRS